MKARPHALALREVEVGLLENRGIDSETEDRRTDVRLRVTTGETGLGWEHEGQSGREE